MTPSPTRRLVGLAGWLAVTPMAGFVLARALGLLERAGRLFALEVLTLWLLVPAYVVLAVALVTRRRALAGVAALVVLAHLAWVAPDLRWWPREHRAGRGPAVRVVSSNTLHSNPDPVAAAVELGRLHPDVLVVLELSPAMARALAATPTLAGLQHRFTEPHDDGDAFGAAIWSRFPLTEQRIGELTGFPLLSARVAMPGGSATVYAVHTLQPLAGLAVLRSQLAELDYVAERTAGPVILAGDFNATRQHRGFRALLQHGLHDAHLQRGRGLARTWSVTGRVPPFALLDHVLVSRHFVVRDVDEATVPGSDHRAVVAVVRRR